MYNSVLHLHSGIRWILLFLLVAAILNSYASWKADKNFSGKNKMLALFTFIFSHLQLTIGLIMYFWDARNKVSFASGMMKDSALRFYTIEHLTMMILAIALITFGYLRAKKETGDRAKHRKIFVWYSIAFLVILAAIPWPFRIAGAGWF